MAREALTPADARAALVEAKLIPATQRRGRLSAAHWTEAERLTRRKRETAATAA